MRVNGDERTGVDGDDASNRAELEADPWRDLEAWDFSDHHADAGPSGATAVSSAARALSAARSPGAPAEAVPAGVNAWLAWLACDDLPGTRLRWVRTGALRSELRAERRQVSASVRRRLPWTGWSGQAGVVRVGGRAFTSQRNSQSASPRPAAARVLVDPSGLPALYISGQNFNHRAGAHTWLPDGRWFQFPVRGQTRGSGIMTALDQDSGKVALYRMVPAGGRLPAPRHVEIAVHPDQQITDELLLVLAVSAPWLWTYFLHDSGGG